MSERGSLNALHALLYTLMPCTLSAQSIIQAEHTIGANLSAAQERYPGANLSAAQDCYPSADLAAAQDCYSGALDHNKPPGSLKLMDTGAIWAALQ
jgi:hypothetical protein